LSAGIFEQNYQILENARHPGRLYVPLRRITFSSFSFISFHFFLLQQSNNDINAEEVVADNGTGAGAASRRGGGYTATEDMLACKAFIVASEDSQKGTSQKKKEFKATMHSAYKLLIK
jgi:hypothetical protein